MAALDFALNKVVPISIYVAIILVVITFAASLIQFDIKMHEEEEEAMMDSILVDHDPYATATRHINAGALGKALATYSEIIRNDKAGNQEEDAWHEKGKILNRLGYCNDAVNHYANFLAIFPDSKRASEGYDLARQCQ